MTKDSKLKRQGSRVDKSESLRKRKRKFVQNRKLIAHHVEEILRLLLKNMSHQHIINSDVVVDAEWYTTINSSHDTV